MRTFNVQGFTIWSSSGVPTKSEHQSPNQIHDLHVSNRYNLALYGRRGITVQP